MTRRVVLVESPYSGHPDALRYLACCLLDSVLRGEAPIASHALYPLALPEHVESFCGKTGREIGLECRDALAFTSGVGCVSYVDLGTTAGMSRGGSYISDRKLTGAAKAIFDNGEWPSMARMTANHEVER